MPRRLAALRGAGRPARPLDARAISALAANPGCRRRALLDGAGVDKAALAQALGAPAPFGQSQFAFARGHAFESRLTADNGAALVALLRERMGGDVPEPEDVAVPDLSADGPAGRAERTRLALAEADRAAAEGRWTLLAHPMLELDVGGSPVHLEPDAVTVAPDGRRTVVEIKSFPILDGSADPAKVGAAARQAAVYALALARMGGAVDERALLVCPKDFSNQPTAAAMDLRRQVAAVRRQLDRLTRVEEIAGAVPDGVSFDPDLPAGELAAAVATVPAAYDPQCLAGCELAFHCRGQARSAGEVTTLGRGARGELGGLATVRSALDAARGLAGDPADPAVTALRRAARLRAEALAEAPGHGCEADAGAGGVPGARAAGPAVPEGAAWG
ncbi:hypothetical protein QNO07_09830 [Streptomyces sp. 549]|uniref:hypothetical protein n=1 Tax=Streptomyces sp. 549 TaxID=3049076 RepID=UPI0024C36D66|nr:hypothetical protein [Streptomyces sp. 549]MDK1473719.1 hypothetical protein [Streptomyces sp. 549]